eukprot:974737-Ditylum_brightwellii.AAC.1
MDISDMTKDVYVAPTYYLVLDQKQNAFKFVSDDLASKVYANDCKVTSKVTKEWQTVYQHCVLDTWSSKYTDTFDRYNEDTTM